jgi:hypothetical protein
MATFPSKADYVTGEVLTATNMNDIGGAINLLESAQYAAGKNEIINGDFGVWQRGTTLATFGYLADRFYGDTNATVTQSRQTFTAGTAPVAGYEGQFFYRMAKSAGGTYASLQQKIEDVRTFAGQTVTLSFWGKIDTGTLSVGTVFEQNFGSGGSTAVYTYGSNVTLTTSWTRFTTTVAIPSITGKTIGTSSFLNIYPFNATTAAAITFDIWGVQVEAASTASNFQTATGTKQGELAACQRYYFRQSASASNAYAVYGFGSATATTTMDAPIKFAQTMRTTPTAIEFSNLGVSADNATIISVSAATFVSGETGTDNAMVRFAATCLTQYRPYGVYSNNSTSAYLGFSAEL